MLIRRPELIPGSEITDLKVFQQRRNLIKGLAVSAVAGAFSPLAAAITGAEPLPGIVLPVTPKSLVENYTNYYEFSLYKDKSARLAQQLKLEPWKIEISGELERPVTLDMDDLAKAYPVQEFIYRFRCVEGWAMVVPWQGFPLHALLKNLQPLSTAKFVKFTSVTQPETMPSQQNKVMLDWPYTEALRIDEAAHPLTILATGMYGSALPKQNGAPLRLIVPWKYGFKSIKAIVKIELLRNPPVTSWNQVAPNEYGFYANVNPAVPHPRWSQSSERLLGSKFFTERRKTELFNGYGEQVSHLYTDMNLRHFF